MFRNRLIFLLLLPLSLLYGGIVSLRNLFYDKGLLKSISFDVPIISVGNLSVGGAGKTPHIEYLILLLKDYIKVATLSRGYKRKTSGFLMVDPHMDAAACGDEPLQFKRKFSDIEVAVSESRVLGVPKLLGAFPDVQVILLDDAFQHRSIKAGKNILLTEYSGLYTKDFMLPSGRLREWSSASQRADIIIVSKCPHDFTKEESKRVVEELSPLSSQKVFFSKYIYGAPYYMYNNTQRLQFKKSHNIILVSAIAGTDYLMSYLTKQVGFVHNLEFEDHHDFSKNEMGQIKKVFDNMDLSEKYIVTTEKDAVRMDVHRDFLTRERIPVFVLPVRVSFLFEQADEFDEEIKSFLLNFQV